MQGLVLAVGFAIVLPVAALVAQGASVTITLTDDQVATIKKVVGRTAGIDPTTVTDLEARQFVLGSCKGAMLDQVRQYRQDEDRVTINDWLLLSDAEREQVKQYVLSLKK